MRDRATWYTKDKMNSWDRIKAAFANDWEQTKNDFGSKSARDLDQDVDDTLKQAAGSKDAFENREQAFRFGYAAQDQYRAEFPEWNDELETRLRKDYEGEYDADREYIRHAYGYHTPTV
jgi:hypothetical protein